MTIDEDRALIMNHGRAIPVHHGHRCGDPTVCDRIARWRLDGIDRCTPCTADHIRWSAR